MASQKAENLLNLSLDATDEEREKSQELSVGFDPIDRVWDLIIKYSGDLARVRELADQVAELQNEYAIITIKESLITRLTEIPEVEYIEKPKRLFFQIINGKRVSCIDAVQRSQTGVGQSPDQGIGQGLFGKGVLIGIIDSGIDYASMDFRNADGSTRIRALWDQSLALGQGRVPPLGYTIGAEYTAEQINEALLSPSQAERFRLVPSLDTSGHGTAVAGIAAGNGANAGVAPESELIVVKLGTPRQEGFPRTTELMQGIDYVIRKAMEYRMPVAVNVSFGNTYGSHEPYN